MGENLIKAVALKGYAIFKQTIVFLSFENLLKYLVRMLYPQINIDLFVNLYVKKTKLNVLTHGNLILGEQIDKYTHKYFKADLLNDKEFMSKVVMDISKCFLLYDMTVREYFNFDIANKNHNQRKEFLTLKLKDEEVIKSLGKEWHKYFFVLKDKNIFYNKAKKWFKRSACKIENESDLSAFSNFADIHKVFIAKPSQGSHGWGAKIINMEEYNNSVATAFKSLLETGTSWIVEELIQQDEMMSQWNESSVNTLRIPSILTSKGSHYIFYPYFRVGRKGSIVDNAGSGNPYALIDSGTGIICTDGMDEYGSKFVEHPDSHIPFKGFQIPQWGELMTLCEEIHKTVLADHRYVGFDFALSKKGWVVVEANWGTFTAQQSLLGRGIKNEFLTYMHM